MTKSISYYNCNDDAPPNFKVANELNKKLYKIYNKPIPTIIVNIPPITTDEEDIKLCKGESIESSLHQEFQHLKDQGKKLTSALKEVEKKTNRMSRPLIFDIHKIS